MSYNFHASYSMASGIALGLLRTAGREPATAFVVALQVDLIWLAMPVIALYELARGPKRH